MKYTEEMTMFYDGIGSRVKELRVQHGWSRETLAEITQLNRVTIYNIEINKRGFTAYTLAQLVRALDTSASYLLFGDAISGNEKLQECLERVSEVLDEEQLTLLCLTLDALVEKIKTLKK